MTPLSSAKLKAPVPSPKTPLLKKDNNFLNTVRDKNFMTKMACSTPPKIKNNENSTPVKYDLMASCEKSFSKRKTPSKSRVQMNSVGCNPYPISNSQVIKETPELQSMVEVVEDTLMFESQVISSTINQTISGCTFGFVGSRGVLTTLSTIEFSGVPATLFA